jgi:arylsulfatase A-like enzyme
MSSARHSPFHLALCLLLLVLGGACSRREATDIRAKNILVISLCSVRADHMSLHGYPRATSPAIDALSQEAWVFSHAVTQWPKTVPAFASLLTGRYGHSNGVMRVTPGQRLDDRELTLAEVLRDRGFATAAFISSGAMHEGTNLFQQGFALVDETFRSADSFNLATEHAAAWIAEQREQPFFAWVHYNNAHAPYHAPGAPPETFVGDAWYDPGPQVKINTSPKLDIAVAAGHPYRRQIMRSDIGGIRPGAALPERPNELAFYVARYDAGILGADRTIQPLLEAMRESGRLEDTVVALVGDHGESLGDHNYYFEHGRFPYDDSVRVPFLIRPPGPPGRVARREIGEPVATFRLGPTLLEMVGVPPPPTMEATSLLPRLDGEEPFTPVFTESGYQYDYTLAVRNERHKLIFVPNPSDQALMRGHPQELYDVIADPAELRDLSASQPKVVEELSGVLRKWSQPWIRQAYGRAKDVDITDPGTRARLRALGYLD